MQVESTLRLTSSLEEKTARQPVSGSSREHVKSGDPSRLPVQSSRASSPSSRPSFLRRPVSISSLNPTKHPPPLSSEVVLQYLARCSRGQQLPLPWTFDTPSGQLDFQWSRGQCRHVDVDRFPQLTSIFPQRHQVLCPRKAILRGCLCRRTRRPALSLPFLHQLPLCLYCRRW